MIHTIKKATKAWHRLLLSATLMGAVAMTLFVTQEVPHIISWSEASQMALLFAICVCQLEWFGWRMKPRTKTGHLMSAASWSGAILTLMAMVTLLTQPMLFDNVWSITGILFGALFVAEWASWEQFSHEDRRIDAVRVRR